MPALIVDAGGNPRFAIDEYFRATSSNPHTRRAYARTADRVLGWSEIRGQHLHNVMPRFAGDYSNGMEASAPT